MEMSVFLKKFDKVVKYNKYYKACCPAHNDNTPSLQVWEDKKGYIHFKCYAKCNKNAIYKKLNLTKGDLVTEKARTAFLENKKYIIENSKANNTKINSNQNSQQKPKTKLNIVEEYNYCNVDGKLMYQVIRLEPKDFRMRQIDATGRWSYSIKNVQKVIYNLPIYIKLRSRLNLESLMKNF